MPRRDRGVAEPLVKSAQKVSAILAAGKTEEGIYDEKILVREMSMARKTAKKLQSEGKDIINLGIGQPDFPTPKHIQRAGIYAIQNGHTRYTPGGGTHELKKAIQKKAT